MLKLLQYCNYTIIVMQIKLVVVVVVVVVVPRTPLGILATENAS